MQHALHCSAIDGNLLTLALTARPAEALHHHPHRACTCQDMINLYAVCMDLLHATHHVASHAMQVMREGIARHRGYEIGTEGDSFQIGFRTVEEAVLFCMEAQMRLLETGWPREVLKLGPCKVVADGTREVLFRGPRVRMGIHWAVDGTIANRCVLTRGQTCAHGGSVIVGVLQLVQPADLEMAHSGDVTGLLRRQSLAC